MLRFIYIAIAFIIGIVCRINAAPHAWDALISLRQQCEPQCKVQWSDPPEILPNLYFETETSGRALEEEEGHPLLLHFWAPWCAACVAEMPELDILSKLLKKRGYKVMAVSVDYRGLDVVKEFYEKYAIKYLEIALDPKNKLGEQLKITGLPVTLVINAEGKEVARLAGNINWHHEGLKDWLLALTKPPI